MSHFSYRRLEYDLYWGERLLYMSIIHSAQGFRGKAKGKGFRAYLQAEGIPARKAYRLIRRYRLLRSIWGSVRDANASVWKELEKKLGPPPSLEQLEKAIESLEVINGDNGSVTNASGSVQ